MCRAAFAHETYYGMCRACSYRRPALSMQAITHATCDTPMLIWSTGRAILTAIQRVACCRTFTMRVLYACRVCIAKHARPACP